VDTLVRIKRLVVAGRIEFTAKAEAAIRRKGGAEVFYVLISSKLAD
jgi:hypothetical protein